MTLEQERWWLPRWSTPKRAEDDVMGSKRRRIGGGVKKREREARRNEAKLMRQIERVKRLRDKPKIGV
jgi:hypothetical protein